MNGKQLKNSILQWAIQGKLVPQDPNDEPASVLLERIREEKERLIKEKKIKRDKNASVIFRGEDNSYYEKMLATGEVKCIDEEIPFEIPQGWEWCRMQDVITFVNGRAYKKEELLTQGKYKVLRVGNFFTNNHWYYSDLELPEDKYCYNGDLLYAWSASFGPQIWEGDKTIFHYHIWNVKYNTRVLFREFLYYFFLFDKTQVKASTTGSTMIHVSMENMKPRLIPIPPVEEQKRIVCGIEDIMPFLEKYELLQSEKDILDESIEDALKKSILQEAIQGRLVPQLAEDGTAEELLEQVKTEKQKLVKEGKLKKPALATSIIFRGDDNKYWEKKENNVVCIDDEIPFEIPNSWNWCRLKDIGRTETGTTPSKSHPEYFGNYIPFLSPANILGSKIISETQGLSSIGIEFGRVVPKNSILQVCIGGSIGKCAIVNKPATFNQQINSITPYLCNVEFVHIVLQSEYFRLAIMDKATGTATPIINRGNWETLLFPLPPLKEQLRIIEKYKGVTSIMSR